MCVTCGCGQADAVRIEGEHGSHEHVLADGTRVVHQHHDHDHDHGHGHSHDHGHSHGHEHPHDHGHDYTHNHAALRKDAPVELVALETALLDKNQRIAERNRGWLAGRGVLALNLMSSPGSGKTTLLVRTLTDLKSELKMSVVEGDQETVFDAERVHFHAHSHQGGDSHVHGHVHGRAVEGAVSSDEPHAEQTHDHPHRMPARGLLVGMVHGLAGSAALALMVSQTLPTPTAQLLYIALFGLGSLLGMALLSGALAYSLSRSAARLTVLNGAFNAVVAGLSVLLGLRLLVVNG